MQVWFCFVLFLIGEYFIVPYTAHTMPTSSEWRQLCRPTPACLQLAKRLSVPPHATSSKRIGPVPPWKRTRAEVTPGKPSCLQATRASGIPHKSSQTMPHRPCRKISSRPWLCKRPPTRRSWPLYRKGGRNNKQGDQQSCGSLFRLQYIGIKHASYF